MTTEEFLTMKDMISSLAIEHFTSYTISLPQYSDSGAMDFSWSLNYPKLKSHISKTQWNRIISKCVKSVKFSSQGTTASQSSIYSSKMVKIVLQQAVTGFFGFLICYFTNKSEQVNRDNADDLEFGKE